MLVRRPLRDLTPAARGMGAVTPCGISSIIGERGQIGRVERCYATIEQRQYDARALRNRAQVIAEISCA